MNHQKILAMTSITLFCVASNASGHGKMRTHDMDSPAAVVTPPNGYPGGSMSTADSGGNGFMARARRHQVQQREARKERAAMEEDRMVYHSAAPRSESETWDRRNAHFVSYGEDIPAFRGLQLEMALNRLHHINQKEIELAKIAESRAKSPEVLSLAHRIRADHEAMENKVVALANRRGVHLERFQLATYEQSLKDRLNKLEAPDFETAFLRVTERGHTEAAAELRMVRNDISDTEVRGLINQELPQMAAHKHLPEINKSRASEESDTLGD